MWKISKTDVFQRFLLSAWLRVRCGKLCRGCGGILAVEKGTALIFQPPDERGDDLRAAAVWDG